MRLPACKRIREIDARPLMFGVERDAQLLQYEPGLQMRDDKGRGHDLEAEHAAEGRALDHLASERPIAAFRKGRVDPAQDSGEIRAGAATRVENVDLVGSDAVGDPQI